MNDIAQQIRDYISINFLFSDESYPLADDVSFLQESIVDSTGVLELVMFVEETFAFTVDDEEIVPENFDSITQLTKYIQRKNP